MKWKKVSLGALMVTMLTSCATDYGPIAVTTSRHREDAGQTSVFAVGDRTLLRLDQDASLQIVETSVEPSRAVSVIVASPTTDEPLGLVGFSSPGRRSQFFACSNGVWRSISMDELARVAIERLERREDPNNEIQPTK